MRRVLVLLAVGLMLLACSPWTFAQEMWSGEIIVKDEGRFLDDVIQSAKGESLGCRKIPHPALKSQRDAMSRVRSFLDSLGLTPAARRRLEVSDGEEHDEFQALMGGR